MEKVLSIRLAADGLSFSCAQDTALAPSGFFAFGGGTPVELFDRLCIEGKIDPSRFQRVILEIDTDKVLPVPTAVLEEGTQKIYLDLHNIQHGAGEVIVVTPSDLPIRAIIVAPAQPVEFLAEKWGDKLSFWSPLLDCMLDKNNGTLKILLSRHFAYAIVTEEKLEYAQALPYSSPADLLYYMARLQDNFDIRHSTTVILGANNKKVAGKLRKYYPGVTVKNAYR